MILSEISIRRPISALVFSTLLLIFGVISFLRLPVRELPDVEIPSVTISTTYEGASPEVIETRVTKVIEDELSGISGVKQITSNSRSGGSWIAIEFNQNKDMLEAISDVRDAVSRASKNLPDDELRRVMLVRSLLDFIAVIFYVLKLDFSNAAAVIKAIRDYKTMRKDFSSLRKFNLNHTKVFKPKQKCNFSLILQSKVLGKTTYSQLVR